MKKNMGTIDRVLRILLAIVVAVLYMTGAITSVLAVIFLLTGLIGFCPLYVPFKISTIGKSK
jgi:hypothetical protein